MPSKQMNKSIESSVFIQKSVYATVWNMNARISTNAVPVQIWILLWLHVKYDAFFVSCKIARGSSKLQIGIQKTSAKLHTRETKKYKYFREKLIFRAQIRCVEKLATMKVKAEVRQNMKSNLL